MFDVDVLGNPNGFSNDRKSDGSTDSNGIFPKPMGIDFVLPAIIPTGDRDLDGVNVGVVTLTSDNERVLEVFLSRFVDEEIITEDSGETNDGAPVLIISTGNKVGILNFCLDGLIVGEIVAGDTVGTDVSFNVLVVSKGNGVGLPGGACVD